MEHSRLLQKLASEEALWSAWDEVRTSRGAPGVDGVTVGRFERGATEQIRLLAEELLDRRYRPRPLRRIWVPKRGKEHEYRPISVPAVRDRIAAGAANLVLQHVFEPLLHDSSFGFRPGRGTLGALRRLFRLRDDGFRYVARADIHEFFAAIDQYMLFERLRPLLPWDVCRLLLLWVRPRVVDGADRFRMTRGVPQGTPTSPLLSNFFLIPFDEHLEFEGHRAVRYADDVAVAAKSRRGAQTALTAMDASLDLLGLRLNADSKTTRSFDEGFEFLGFELRGRTVRVAPSKVDEFRRHAVLLLEDERAGSMRRRIALLNRMIRGWRAYYRIGIPRSQFEELDAWLESQVRTATLRRWARDRPRSQDLELAGLESLAVAGRRIFQPPSPPSLEGYEYRLPLEGDDSGDRDLLAVRARETVAYDDTGCHVVGPDRARAAIRPGVRAVIISDGAHCQARALRHLLDRGTALHFVPAEAVPAYP